MSEHALCDAKRHGERRWEMRFVVDGTVRYVAVLPEGPPKPRYAPALAKDAYRELLDLLKDGDTFAGPIRTTLATEDPPVECYACLVYGSE